MSGLAVGDAGLPRRGIATQWLGTNAALIGLCLLAFAVRLLPVVIAPSLNWADEIFQATEQAHRLVYGHGLVPWEFQLGARSWLLPGAIACIMAFAKLFGDGPALYLPLIAAACSLLALVPVVCCYSWCRRLFGTNAALVGAFAVAVAPELIYFGPRTLSEAVAGHLLVLGIYLLDPGFPAVSRQRAFAAGAILALVCMLRIQLAPAAGLIGLAAVLREWRGRAVAFAVGGATVLAASGLLDLATIGYPFASVWRYLWFNLFDGVSSGFGTAPWYWYGAVELAVWGPYLWVLLLLAIIGSRRMPLPMLAAVVIVVAHAFVPHKEYRFIYPATVLIAVQAGLGLATVAHWMERRLARLPTRVFPDTWVAGLLAIAWGLVSLAVWNGPALAGPRHASQGQLAAALFVARAHGICGIGLYDRRGDAWARYGGYTYLHQPVPIYWARDADLRAIAASIDVLLYTPPSGPQTPLLPSGFRRERCFGNVCIARRSGGCEPSQMAVLPEPSSAVPRP